MTVWSTPNTVTLLRWPVCKAGVTRNQQGLCNLVTLGFSLRKLAKNLWYTHSPKTLHRDSFLIYIQHMCDTKYNDNSLCFTSAIISGGNMQWLWYFWLAHMACDPERVCGIIGLHYITLPQPLKTTCMVTCNHVLWLHKRPKSHNRKHKIHLFKSYRERNMFSGIKQYFYFFSFNTEFLKILPPINCRGTLYLPILGTRNIIF